MENTESVWLSSDRVYRFLPSCVVLCCASLLTSLPPTSQNYSLDSLLLLFPFHVLGLVHVACSDQFVRFYNRTQPGRLAVAQRPCFLGLQKKLKEGIVGKQKVSALHQPKKVNECKISMLTHVLHVYYISSRNLYMQTGYIHLYTPHDVPSHIWACKRDNKEWGPGKLGQQSYFSGSALFGLCRVS